MGTDAKKPAKQKSRLHMTHAQNDARYIAQGMTLFLSPNPDSAKDLARMNEGKNGRPFIYDEETMMVIAGIVYQLGLACRGCEGLAIMALGEENAPDHTTIWRRINKMDVSFHIFTGIFLTQARRSGMGLVIECTNGCVALKLWEAGVLLQTRAVPKFPCFSADPALAMAPCTGSER